MRATVLMLLCVATFFVYSTRPLPAPAALDDSAIKPVLEYRPFPTPVYPARPDEVMPPKSVTIQIPKELEATLQALIVRCNSGLDGVIKAAEYDGMIRGGLITAMVLIVLYIATERRARVAKVP